MQKKQQEIVYWRLVLWCSAITILFFQGCSKVQRKEKQFHIYGMEDDGIKEGGEERGETRGKRRAYPMLNS